MNNGQPSNKILGKEKNKNEKDKHKTFMANATGAKFFAKFVYQNLVPLPLLLFYSKKLYVVYTIFRKNKRSTM